MNRRFDKGRVLSFKYGDKWEIVQNDRGGLRWQEHFRNSGKFY